ncbi:MAG TPA: anti-sigma factor [Bryobacteraceae bacterium]|nr:anti-sigma factor [Bryobacteraceae bacterium]
MNHEELGDLYELYTLGVLEEPERAEIEQHLKTACPECQAGVKGALALNALLATLPETLEPPKRLRRRVLASVGMEPAGSFWKNAWALAAVALAMVLFVVALDSQRRNQELAGARGQLRRTTSDLAQARAEIQQSSAELRQVRSALTLLNLPNTREVVFGGATAQPPRGRVFVNRQQGVLLLASNLPPAPSGKTYELWLIPRGGNPVPSGLFQSDIAGNALFVRSGPVQANTAAVAVSLEPETGSTAPTTTPVIVASVTD